MSIERWRTISAVLMISLIFVCDSNSATACQFGTPDDAGKSVWNMSTGDSFTVAVVISKQTTTTQNNQPTTTETSDRFRIEYRAARVRKNGDAIVAAMLREPSRDTVGTSPSLKSTADRVMVLEDVALLFQLDKEGIVQGVSPSDRQEIINLLTGTDAKLAALLSRSLPNEVMASWISRPFWLALAADQQQPMAEWKRTLTAGCGPFGTAEHEIQLTLNEIKDSFGSVSATATSRFVPLVLPAAEVTANTDLLTNVKVSVEDFQLTARMAIVPLVQSDPPSLVRPQFESLDLKVRVAGSGDVPASGAKANGSVTFTQTVAESWILEGSAFGRPEFLFSPVAPVIPVQ